MLALGIGIGIGYGGGSALDPDAATWAAAVATNGGSVSSTTLAAVNTFCKNAKTNGYWTRLNRINLFCGNQLAAALVPLKVGAGNSTDTNVNFVAGDYTEATGLTGNGSTKYLRTGIIPSVSLPLNDTHVAVYNRSSTASGSIAIGSNNSASQTIALYAPSSDSRAYLDCYSTGVEIASPVLATPFGAIVGSRTSSASQAIYRNGSSVASAANSGGSLPSFELYVFANNGSGSVGLVSTGPFAAYSIGYGLSATDAANYYSDLQTFQTALGRQV